MHTYTATETVTITREIGEVWTTPTERGTYIVAQEDPHAAPEKYDACGTGVLRIGPTGTIPTAQVAGCCDYCDDHAAAMRQAAEAWNTAWSNGDNPEDAVVAAAERHGFSVAGLTPWTGAWTVAPLHGGTLEPGAYLVVSTGDNAMADARNHAAYLNGFTWTVGELAAEQVANEEPVTASDTLVVGGFIWDNVDLSGYSTPTVVELEGAI